MFQKNLKTILDQGLAISLVFTALAFTVLALPAVAQDAANDAAALEAQAEQAYAEDDLVLTAVLYRRAAEAEARPDEKSRILTALALVHYQAAQDGEAMAALSEAMAITPEMTFRGDAYPADFRPLFLEAQKRAVDERRRRSDDFVRQGLTDLRQQSYDDARRNFQEALGYRPDHPGAIYNLALTDLSQRRNEDALAGFQKLLSLAEQNPAQVSAQMRALALTNLGYLHQLAQRFDEAERVLAQAVGIDPSIASAWSNLGVTRRNLGKPEAAEAFQRAYELDRDNPQTMNHLALAYIDTEQWIDAVALLKRATEGAPEDPSIWLNFGVAQTGLGNIEGALQSFQQAIALDAGNRRGIAAAAAVKLTEHYLATGQQDAALREAEKLITLAPQDSEGWVFKGQIRKAQGDLESARQSLEEARRLAPEQAAIHNNLGSVYYDLGRRNDAEAAFRRALDIDPTMSAAQENLRAVQGAPATGTASPPPPRAAQTRPAPPPPRTSPPPPPPARTSPPPPPRTTSRPAPPPPRGRTRTEAPPTARIGKLGIQFSSIDYAALGLQGVLVESVKPGSLAAKAGIEGRDLILKVDGREVNSGADVQRFAQEADKAEVVVDLLRSNAPRRVTLSVR